MGMKGGQRIEECGGRLGLERTRVRSVRGSEEKTGVEGRPV